MLTKTQQRKLLGLVKRVLTHRRNMRPKAEEKALHALYTYCHAISVDPSDAMDQGIEWLKRNSIAASMNGLA